MNRSNKLAKLPGEMFVLLAAMLWGTTGTSQALAPANADPLVIGAMRQIIGSLLLLLIAILTTKTKLVSPNFPRLTTVIAALSVAAYQVLFFAGVKLTGVAVGTVVGIGSSPLFGGLLGYLFRREKLGWRWFLATALAVLGCLLLFSVRQDIMLDPLGVTFAIGAGLSYALFTLMSKAVLETTPLLNGLAIIFSLAALILFPLLFFRDTSWLRQEQGIIAVLHLGIFTLALAYTLFAKGLTLTNVSTATTLTLAEPLTAASLGYFILKETLTLSAFFGFGFIITGLLILVLPHKKNVRKVPES